MLQKCLSSVYNRLLLISFRIGFLVKLVTYVYGLLTQRDFSRPDLGQARALLPWTPIQRTASPQTPLLFGRSMFDD